MKTEILKIIIEDSYLKTYDENNVLIGYLPKNNAPILNIQFICALLGIALFNQKPEIKLNANKINVLLFNSDSECTISNGYLFD